MRQLPDSPLGGLEPHLRLHRARQEGIVDRLSGPGALVQPAEDHRVDGLQPRLERAEDEDARMAEGAGLDRFAGCQRLDDIDPLRPVRLHLAVGLDDLSQQSCQAFAGLARPERREIARRIGAQ